MIISEQIKTANLADEMLNKLNADCVSDILDSTHWFVRLNEVRDRARFVSHDQIVNYCDELIEKYNAKFYGE